MRVPALFFSAALALALTGSASAEPLRTSASVALEIPSELIEEATYARHTRYHGRRTVCRVVTRRKRGKRVRVRQCRPAYAYRQQPRGVVRYYEEYEEAPVYRSRRTYGYYSEPRYYGRSRYYEGGGYGYRGPSRTYRTYSAPQPQYAAPAHAYRAPAPQPSYSPPPQAYSPAPQGRPPGHGGTPPGHGGMPPGQAKKMR